MGIEESSSPEEMQAAIATAGDCCLEEVVVGALRKQKNGLLLASLQCPVAASLQHAKIRQGANCRDEGVRKKASSILQVLRVRAHTVHLHQHRPSEGCPATDAGRSDIEQ